jgi:hypothetical protein
MVAAASALLLAGGCSLLDPKPRTEYTLVAVNGKSLPAVLDSGPIMMYTDAQTFVVRTYVLRQVSGALQISGHDFSLVTGFDRTFDGESRPDFPPGEDKAEGYFHGPDSLAIFESRAQSVRSPVFRRHGRQFA